MQQEKNPVGRPPSKNKKTKWLKIRVTDEVFSMLKYAPKSKLINDGLRILMPILGVWNKDENRWIEHKEKGTDANLVAYNAICYAIETIRTQREFINRQHKENEPYFTNGYFSSGEAELLNVLCLQKATLETHPTFYDLSAKDHK